MNDPHRFIVVEAGRKFGKSITGLIWQAREAALRPNSTNWYIGPTFKQTREIIWERMLNTLEKSAIKKYSNTNHEIFLRNGSMWKVKGADEPQYLRGPGADTVVFDEVRDMRYPNIWDEVIRPELMQRKGKALFISSKTNNWFKKLTLRELVDSEWKTFRFTTFENPYIDKAELETVRKSTPLHIFKKEYLNEDVEYEGLVYPEFEDKIHVVESFPIPLDWPIFVGVDWGISDPTAFIFLAIDPKERNIYAYFEHYLPGKPVKYHAEIVKNIVGSRKPFAFIADPSMWNRGGGNLGTIAGDFAQHGIYLMQGEAKPKTRARSIVKEYLLGPSPRLFFFPELYNTIREFASHCYIQHMEGSEKNIDEKAVDSNDHAINAIEYALTYYRDCYAKKLPMTKNDNEELMKRVEQALYNQKYLPFRDEAMRKRRYHPIHVDDSGGLS